MNFFIEQQNAKRRSKLLVVFLLLALVGIVTAVHLLCSLLLGFTGNPSDTSLATNFYHAALNEVNFLATASATSFIVGLGSIFKLFTLRSGGAKVAESIGGHLLPPDSSNPEERQLLNVVEEMSIAAGIPTPPIYILEESSINAFAAGNTTKDAVIGITRGAMQTLNRDELQGVIAHEYSHILHGDMRVNLRLIGILFGILMLATTGRILLRLSRNSSSSSNSKKDGGAAAILLLGLGLLLIGYIGVFFARLIKAAISRQREFLADASAVQYTRNPLGISGALKKIGALSLGSAISHPAAEQASHMFFGSSFKTSFISLFATHPPLKERIKRIDPRFKGNFKEILEKAPLTEETLDKKDTKNNRVDYAKTILGGMTPDAVMNAIGTLSLENINYAKSVHNNIPEILLNHSRSMLGAQAVVLALLISKQEKHRAEQLKIVQTYKISGIYEIFIQCLNLIESHQNTESIKLPLLDICCPSLRSLSQVESDNFLKVTDDLINIDDEKTTFEFLLHESIKKVLKPTHTRTRNRQKGSLSDNNFLQHAQILISIMASVSTDSTVSASDLYNKVAKSTIRDLPDKFFTVEPKQITTLTSDSLSVFQSASWEQKRILLSALEKIIFHDSKITIKEVEYFRVIADILECPVPPLLRQAY